MAFDSYDKCSILLPMSGSNNGTTFTDWSPSPKTVTVNGNAKTSTTQSKYYGSSGRFDGTGDYLTITTDSSFDFGTGDFTLSAWVYVENYSTVRAILSKYTSWATNVDFYLYVDTNGKVYFRGGDSTAISIASDSAINTLEFVHVAVTRSSGVTKMFINGTQQSATHTGSVSIPNDKTTLVIGANSESTASEFLYGYLQDVFVVKGSALWTGNFTPEKLIGSISGTVKDDTGSNAIRSVTAVPRSNPSRTFHTTSAADGTYSVSVPNTECSVLVLDDSSGTLYNDIVMRVVPG